jgi:hypothetical protein
VLAGIYVVNRTPHVPPVEPEPLLE